MNYIYAYHGEISKFKIEQEVLQSSNVDKIGCLQRNESRLQDFHQLDPRNHPSNIFKDLRNVNLNIEFYI